MTSPADVDRRIVIVGIDEPSFAELNLQWPWPRGIHARLIDQLKFAGAAVIAFDVIFAEPSDPEQDNRLASSISASGNVVLASDLVVAETANFKQAMYVEPYDLFREAGARAGVSAVTLDADLVVRRIPKDPEAFWKKVVLEYFLASDISSRDDIRLDGTMIRYMGGSHSFPYVSYYQALDPDKFLPPGFFKDRIVLVGFDVKASPDPGTVKGEMFATPFMAFSGWPTPGVEIQANLIAGALMERSISEVPGIFMLVIVAFITVLAALAMRRWRPLGSAAIAAFGFLLLIAFSLVLFSYRDRWIPVSSSMAAVTLIYLVQGSNAFLHERQRKRQIKQAFGYYVSPQVVEEIIAHPEKLALGGVRRDLTIMFTDLAGFTATSEHMDPEKVAEMLNRHFTAMSLIIMRHGGTVDKFMGDSIMAFWGAPLDDPDHPVNACMAAIEMQKEMDRLQNKSDWPGASPLFMRTGIHSGPAVVGNMGSTDRFDYTIIGDNVNLASRLEEANNIYGTDILISKSTADQLNKSFHFRFVDRLSVRGRSEPIDICTFCEDERLIIMSRKAVESYRAQNWSEAEALWRAVIEKYPADSIAEVYLKYIDYLRRTDPGPGWDGSVDLDEILK